MRTKEGLEISQRIERLEALLRARSETAWADRLNAAVAGGATGTEILFRVGAELHEFVRSGVAKTQGCEREAKDLRGKIGWHLKRI